MVKTKDGSVIEIWGSEYINRTRDRCAEDENAIILQIEPGHKGQYMVEVTYGEETSNVSNQS